MTENQRLKILQKELGFKTQKSFADALKLTAGALSDILREKPGVGVSANIKRILEKSYNININWLERDVGEMFLRSGQNNPHINYRDTTANKYTDHRQNNNSVAEPGVNYVVKELYEPQPDGIPVYNIPPPLPGTDRYINEDDVKVIAWVKVPGAVPGSFGLFIYGDSMAPYMANGYIGVVRPISVRTDIEWGSVYYLEYGEYRVWKRLLKDKKDSGNIILWCDNEIEIAPGIPKYAAKTIKANQVNRLCLLTDVLQKPHH